MFIFELGFKSDKQYISTIIKAMAEKFAVDVELLQTKEKLMMIMDEEDENLEAYLLSLEETLPASIYLEGSSHRLSDEKPEVKEILKNDLPLDIGLCPTCQKEMFDVTSRRYYYPFTSCNA